MIVFVIAPERTGSTALLHSLRAAGAKAYRTHYLSSGHLKPRLTDPESRARRQRKLEKEERRRTKFEAVSSKAVLTVTRAPLDRFKSTLWYQAHPRAADYYDPDAGAFKPEFGTVLSEFFDYQVYKAERYGRDVYLPWGLPEHPSPGLYQANGGFPVYVLDFARLEQEFAAATEALLGQAVPLIRVHTGEQVGSELYPAFRDFCDGWLAGRLTAFEPAS